ncbi:MAG: hypothetical protein VB086_04630 [Clostridiaceae bacterium]|nr:hypothetical protein [Clostridiaceae bacterium]
MKRFSEMLQELAAEISTLLNPWVLPTRKDIPPKAIVRDVDDDLKEAK